MVAEVDAQSEIEIRYHGVPFGHIDGYALDVLAGVLRPSPDRSKPELWNTVKHASPGALRVLFTIGLRVVCRVRIRGLSLLSGRICPVDFTKVADFHLILTLGLADEHGAGEPGFMAQDFYFT